MLKIAEWTNASYFGRRSKPLVTTRILIARFISPNLIVRAMMKSTRRGGLLGIIGRMGSTGIFLLVNLALLAPLLRCAYCYVACVCGWMGGLRRVQMGGLGVAMVCRNGWMGGWIGGLEEWVDFFYIP